MNMFGETIPFIFELQYEASFHFPNPMGFSRSRFLLENLFAPGPVDLSVVGSVEATLHPNPLPNRGPVLRVLD